MTEAKESRTRHAHFVWIAPLVAVPAFFSYYLFFVRWPLFRDTAWLNIGLLLGAVVLSALGLRAVWSRGLALRVAGFVSVFAATALAAALIVYCYVLSYGLPPADAVAAAGVRVPAVTLVSDTGEAIDLATAGPSLILVFYRGFW